MFHHYFKPVTVRAKPVDELNAALLNTQRVQISKRSPGGLAMLRGT